MNRLSRVLVLFAVLLMLGPQLRGTITPSQVGYAEASSIPSAAKASVQRSTLPPITISLDAREVSRKILHARLTIPVKPGPLTLVYPKWIPGERGPTGPITDLARLRFTAARKTIAWRRDDVDMYAFHLEVPAGA